MRTYEALYIIRPDLADEDIQTITNEVETLITDNGGSIVRSEIWGKRRLAYEVKKFSEGCYVLLRFEAEPEFITRLEDYYRLAEAVIRFMVVHFDARTLRLEAEQARRKEAEIKAGAAAIDRGKKDAPPAKRIVIEVPEDEPADETDKVAEAAAPVETPVVETPAEPSPVEPSSDDVPDVVVNEEA